ncbi:MAG: CvpA family protein [Bryobacteraceae bacterium]
MNWLDILLVLIVASSVVTGFLKGFARVGIGFVAAIVGILFGLWFYGNAGALIQDLIGSRPVANLVGFILVFGSVLILGSMFGALVAKVFRWVGLGWMDRLMGGAFGVVRGVLIAAGVLLAIMAFAPAKPSSVAASRVAPYVVGAAGAFAALAPRELKDGFHETYGHVRKIWDEAMKQGVKRLPVEQF